MRASHNKAARFTLCFHSLFPLFPSTHSSLFLHRSLPTDTIATMSQPEVSLAHVLAAVGLTSAGIASGSFETQLFEGSTCLA